MLKTIRSSDKLVFKRNNSRKRVFRQNNNNNEVNSLDSGSVELLKKSEKSKG